MTWIELEDRYLNTDHLVAVQKEDEETVRLVYDREAGGRPGPDKEVIKGSDAAAIQSWMESNAYTDESHTHGGDQIDL